MTEKTRLEWIIESALMFWYFCLCCKAATLRPEVQQAYRDLVEVYRKGLAEMKEWREETQALVESEGDREKGMNEDHGFYHYVQIV